MDTTSLHRFEGARSETHLLLGEFSHRINNEFAAIISTVSLARERTKSEEARLPDMVGVLLLCATWPRSETAPRAAPGSGSPPGRALTQASSRRKDGPYVF